MHTIDFAINMELEGKKYYLEQADINKDNELNTVFHILAKSEQEHANLLIKFQKNESFYLTDSFIRPEIKSVFKDLQSFQKEHTQKQLDVYRMASSQEEKSIELYKDMLQNADNPLDKELFKYLIAQENEHLHLFEDLVIMLLRPEEWVESAEFGIREEY
ncbi:MAG: rubrerythrin [Lachnospiraceae bacterium]|jgi:rubrerythrin|nr:rubrerythrin [Lachnospiraceae bacterium]